MNRSDLHSLVLKVLIVVAVGYGAALLVRDSRPHYDGPHQREVTEASIKLGRALKVVADQSGRFPQVLSDLPEYKELRSICDPIGFEVEYLLAGVPTSAAASRTVLYVWPSDSSEEVAMLAPGHFVLWVPPEDVADARPENRQKSTGQKSISTQLGYPITVAPDRDEPTSRPTVTPTVFSTAP